MDLVIMAAGMGSRFGGLKQLEPMDEYGNFIIDYSIYDAIRAGFDKVVFIIKRDKDFLDLFNSTIKKRMDKLSDKIKIEYVYQDFSNVPAQFTISNERTKPLGTAQAILCCKDVVKDNFIIINADDFYGCDAYKVASNYIRNEQNSSDDYGLIAYEVQNTLSETDSVKRGVCQCDGDRLTSITESSIKKTNEGIIATPLDETLPQMRLNPHDLVSMNMWCFTPKLFDYLETEFVNFLSNELPNNPLKAEFLIPTVVDKLIKANKVDVKIEHTIAKWYGVTYREDKAEVENALKNYRNNGVYPDNLWGESTQVQNEL